MCYYLYFVGNAYLAFRRNLPPFPITDFPKLSVIVPARNEASKLEACLESLCMQRYPADCFEVMLIDDHSTDGTKALAQALMQTYPNLAVYSLQDSSSKKAALSFGIARARGEIILQTDADCLLPPFWLSSMTGYFDAQTGMVSGPVKLTYEADNWFQQVQALEFIGLNMLGAGSIGMGRPNMCNGANLAFRKEVFEEVGGYTGIDGVASGDDELLMQKIAATDWKIRYAATPHALVQTAACKDFAAFWQQRTRWVSKARNYLDRSINFVQAMFFLAISGLAVNALLGFFYPLAWILALSAFGAKCCVDALLMRKAAVFFGERRLLRYFFLLQLLYIPYVSVIGIVGNSVKQYQWKGRDVR